MRDEGNRLIRLSPFKDYVIQVITPKDDAPVLGSVDCVLNREATLSDAVAKSPNNITEGQSTPSGGLPYGGFCS